MIFLTLLNVSSKIRVLGREFYIFFISLGSLTDLTMKKTTKAPTPRKLYCNLFGHNYQVSKKVTLHVKEYTCTCCKRQLTTNGNGDLTELTPKFREINTILEAMYVRRMERAESRVFNEGSLV